MKILRTIVWVLAALGFVIFAAYNWEPVELRLWQNLVLETKVPMLALIAFTAGFLPMWAVHRSVVWGQNRRIRALENSLKNSALAYRSEAAVPFVPAAAGDSPVDKPGKGEAQSSDPLDPTDTATSSASDGGTTGE